MKIGALSRKTGFPASAIRYFEEEGLIPPPARSSGKRVYDEEAVARLAVVRLARETGFTIAETRQLVREFGAHRWRRLAERKRQEIRSARERLDAMSALLEQLLACACPDIAFCGRALERRERALRARRADARDGPGPKRKKRGARGPLAI